MSWYQKVHFAIFWRGDKRRKVNHTALHVCDGDRRCGLTPNYFAHLLLNFFCFVVQLLLFSRCCIKCCSLLFAGEMVLDAVSRGITHNTQKLSAVLVDGLVDIGRQQNVRGM